MLKKLKNKYDKSLENAFLSEALKIVEKPASPIGHFMIWITIAIVVSTIIWACFGKMDEVAIDRTSFNVNGTEVSISSGMSGTAEIKLEERRIIEFFLEPVFEYFDDSLKVR